MMVRETMSMDSSWVRYVGKQLKLLQTDALTHTHTHKSFIQMFVHREAVAQRSFYTRTLFTQKPFTQTLLHTEALTSRFFCKKVLLHTKYFTERNFDAQMLLHQKQFLLGYFHFHHKFSISTESCSGTKFACHQLSPRV